MVRIGQDEDQAAPHIERRHAQSTDWKWIIYAIGLIGTGLGFAGNQYRNLLLADMDQRIASHSSAAQSDRTEFFRELERKAGTAIDRLGQLEANCRSVNEWRPTVDAAVHELQALNAAKLQRITTLEAIVANLATNDARIERRVDAIDGRGKRTP